MADSRKTISINIRPGDTPQEIKVVAEGEQQNWATADTAADWGYGFPVVQGLVREFTKSWGEDLTPIRDWYGAGQISANAETNGYFLDNQKQVQKLAPGELVDALQVILKPVATRIGKLELTPTIIFREIFDNREGKVDMVGKPTISESIQETVETNWEHTTSIGVSTTVGVEVGSEVDGVKSKIESTISYDDSWGHGGSKSKTDDVGDGVELELTVPPGQMMVAALTANKGVLEVDIDYVAELLGYISMSFWRKGHHHFFDYKPNAIMDLPLLSRYQDKLSSELKNTQKINFDFFADGIAAGYPITSTEPEAVDDAILHGRENGSHVGAAITNIRKMRVLGGQAYRYAELSAEIVRGISA